MFPDADESIEIDAELLHRLRTDGIEFRLIDCREPDEYALCRIDSAQLIPLSEFAEKAPPALADDSEQPIVIYCHHGMRSLQATSFLRQRGHRKVFSLAGGIERWSQDIDPAVPRY